MATHRWSRRSFLKTVGIAGPVAGGSLLTVPLSPRAFAAGDVADVPLPPEVASWVRLLETTRRSDVLPVFAAKVRASDAYRRLLATLFLAGVCNVEPRPSVGFKFHTVLVNQSLHLAAGLAPERDRWLPLFWGLDYFKDAQAQDARERGWAMGPVDESRLPEAEAAPEALRAAMENWDEVQADLAIAAWTRKGASQAMWESLFRFGCRDFRSIGHKAIDVANSHRVLNHIGWRYAEPALRSLVYALLMHEDGNPAGRNDVADSSWRRNGSLVREIERWNNGPPARQHAISLLAVLREADENEACDAVVEQLNQGAAVGALWDALFLGAVELVVRQNGIVALHAVTTTNAIHYAYRNSRDDETRKLLLLQNAAFLPLFRKAMAGRGSVGTAAVDELAAKSSPADEASFVFQAVGKHPEEAAARTIGYFQSGAPAEAWLREARRLLIAKSTGPHDYKFGYAVGEDAAHVSPTWRPNFLAAASYRLLGEGKAENPVIVKARRALSR